MQGTVSPVLLPGHISMIQKEKIESLVEQHIAGTDIFIVEVAVSVANHISVVLDADSSITIDKCVEISRLIEGSLDREAEDFELQVSSPGLDSPFTVIEQYYKNEGKKVSVVDNEGTKYSGILKNVTIGGFDLETEVKIKGKGKEKKEIPFNFDQVKATKIVLTIT